MPTGSTSRSAITILGLGSLLSERSARTTFPDLRNFRCVRIKGFRRIFAHTPSIFVARGIANMESLEMASLSAEPCEGASFVMTAFEVDDDGTGMDAFREREEEFELSMVPYEALDGKPDSAGPVGMLCKASNDADYVKQWGQKRFDDEYTSRGISTIWNWSRDSGLRPCPAYLRHCVIASQRLGEAAHQSFLDDTYLVDRKTTIREYIASHPEIMNMRIEDPVLAERYSG